MTLYILRRRHVRDLINLYSDWTAFSHDISHGHTPESAKNILDVYSGILHEKDARVRIRPGLDDVCSVCKDKKPGCEKPEPEEAELLRLLGFAAGEHSYSIDEIVNRGNGNGE